MRQRNGVSLGQESGLVVAVGTFGPKVMPVLAMDSDVSYCYKTLAKGETVNAGRCLEFLVAIESVQARYLMARSDFIAVL